MFYRALVCPADWWGCEMAWDRAWGRSPLRHHGPCPAKSPPLPENAQRKNTRLYYCKHHRPLFSGAISAQWREKPTKFYYFVCLEIYLAIHIQQIAYLQRTPFSFFWLCVFLRFVCHIIGWSLEQTVSVVATFSLWTELQYLSQSRWRNRKHENKTKNIFKKCLKKRNFLFRSLCVSFIATLWRTTAHHMPGERRQFGVWQGKLQSVRECKSLRENRGAVFKGQSTGNKRTNIKRKSLRGWSCGSKGLKE